MSSFSIGLLSIIAIVVLLYAGMPVAIALAGLSLIGVWLIRENFEIAVNLLSIAASETISDYVFGVIPLFVLMGMFVSIAGIGRDTFTAADLIFHRVRGGLGVATVAANAVFAAVTGVSIASAAVFTKLAVPEMIRAGYDKRFAVGIVAGSSILGMLIPPSLLFVVYAVLTEQSVGTLFLAGVIPGIIMSTAFSIGIVVMAYRKPALIGEAAPTDGGAVALAGPTSYSPGQVFLMIVPVTFLVAVVIGGIYGGFFTATEAGGVGAFAALVLAFLRRSLDATKLWRILVETGHVTAAICIVIIAAQMYSRMLAVSGVPSEISRWFVESGMSFGLSLFIYLLIILLLGTILDSISILLIVVPLAYPIFIKFGVDPIWFGVVTVVAVEIGIITPPFGIGCFVVKGSLTDKSISLHDVFAGTMPFVIMMIIVLVLLVLFPNLSLVLLK